MECSCSIYFYLLFICFIFIRFSDYSYINSSARIPITKIIYIFKNILLCTVSLNFEHFLLIPHASSPLTSFQPVVQKILANLLCEFSLDTIFCSLFKVPLAHFSNPYFLFPYTSSFRYSESPYISFQIRYSHFLKISLFIYCLNFQPNSLFSLVFKTL